MKGRSTATRGHVSGDALRLPGRRALREARRRRLLYRRADRHRRSLASRGEARAPAAAAARIPTIRTRSSSARSMSRLSPRASRRSASTRARTWGRARSICHPRRCTPTRSVSSSANRWHRRWGSRRGTAAAGCAATRRSCASSRRSSSAASRPIWGIASRSNPHISESQRSRSSTGIATASALSDALYRTIDPLMRAAHAVLSRCSCAFGCPACIGPPDEVGSRGKATARALAAAIVGIASASPHAAASQASDG